MTTTRFLVTGLLSILFGSLPFAAMLATDTQGPRNPPIVAQAQTDLARLASAQEKACAALNPLECR
jgi:hypothetical protein